jgi:hypothetical protein
MVNYDVHLGMDDPRFNAVEDLALTVPLPEGTFAGDAILRRPEGDDMPVVVTMEDGKAQLTVPELNIYGYLRIPLQRGDAQ